MATGIALLRRQTNNFSGDTNGDGDYWGYSNVYSDAIMVFSLADIEIDRRGNKVGLCWGDLAAVTTMVRWRILPRSTENQKRVASIEIPSSTSTASSMTKIY